MCYNLNIIKIIFLSILCFCVKSFAAEFTIGSNITDSLNARILAAGTSGNSYQIVLPAGVYYVDPAIGVKLRSNVTIVGEGFNQTIIVALAKPGSVFRHFSPASGQRVGEVRIKKLGVILTHPNNASPKNYYQIGFDFTHIDRSHIEDCYVGNFDVTSNGSISRGYTALSDFFQGIGAVFASAGGGETWIGGADNAVSGTRFWGLSRAISADDPLIKLYSSTYSLSITDNNIAYVESAISIESNYNQGSVIANNYVRYLRNATNSNKPLFGYRINGQGHYLETGDFQYSGSSYLSAFIYNYTPSFGTQGNYIVYSKLTDPQVLSASYLNTIGISPKIE